MLAARYWTEVDPLTGKGAPVEQVHQHVQHLLYRFLRCSRAETPQGSLPAFASGEVACVPGATRLRPVTGRRSLFPTPLPTPPSVGLTAFLPVSRQERYGLPTFPKGDTDGGGALCAPGALGVHDRVRGTPCTHYGALWLKPLSIFGLSLFTTCIESAHTFTIPASQPHLRLMRVETPFPHGFGASRMTVGAVSEGIRQRVTLLPSLVGYCRWNGRSGPYNRPDNQPCDLVSQTTVEWGATRW